MGNQKDNYHYWGVSLLKKADPCGPTEQNRGLCAKLCKWKMLANTNVAVGLFLEPQHVKVGCQVVNFEGTLFGVVLQKP